MSDADTPTLAADSTPNRVSVTMYDVYFGDCFRLQFDYPGGVSRHVLIDCGSSQKKTHKTKVVDRIVADCGGKLDAVVATHRHSDHIGIFGLKGLDEKLLALKPDVVVQPWTEHPDAEEGALRAPEIYTPAAQSRMMGLKAAQKLARRIVKDRKRLMAALDPETQEQIEKIAALSVRDKKAIVTLTKLAKKENRHYVHAGGPSGLDEILPGVAVTVLGPPTLVQSEGIRSQTDWDEDEFWQLHRRLTASAVSHEPEEPAESLLFPEAETKPVVDAPSFVRWVIERMDRAQQLNVKRIVTALDNAMNNTSVILLFEVGDQSLLFSGDAQLENWEYALSKDEWREKLKRTTLYKVGHHASTNATPQSLWKLFENRSEDDVDNRMISLLSTHHGHHARVPRDSLVEALQKGTNLHSSEDFADGELSKTYVL